ncbi:hypothetical protein M6B38_407935 [Iris pallida]|uniref:Uncharacterized protein n=1 Tax=Iris pallida TaxID=29817 RepID=A0AAX6FPB8_IRIPA|nr:hypothetical protein M6B38_407935 [Iris pallida]
MKKHPHPHLKGGSGFMKKRGKREGTGTANPFLFQIPTHFPLPTKQRDKKILVHLHENLDSMANSHLPNRPL